MVKNYTDEQLLAKAKSLKSFKNIPKDYWLIGVRSTQDQHDLFDDKFYLFRGEKFIKATTGTTNSGDYGLKNFEKYNSQGVAHMKADKWHYNLWKNGMHKKKMRALVQATPCEYYRDGNKNNKSEEIGNIHKGIIGLNFHTVTYLEKLKNLILGRIGQWSVGCQVANNVKDYYEIIDHVALQKKISYCLLNEF